MSTTTLRSYAATALTLILGAALQLATPTASAAAPSNDDIGQAVVITDVPSTHTADTSEATFSAGDSGCGSATVWYTFTPASDASYQLDTFGSDYDTTLALMSGAPGNLDLIACVDDTFGLQSGIRAELTAGTAYFIEAGTCCGGDLGQVGPGGNLVLNVAQAQPAPTLTALSLGPIHITGLDTATVTGTVACTGSGTVFGQGTVRQAQGLNLARADYSFAVDCSDERAAWTATVEFFNRVLHPGPAQVTLGAVICDAFGCGDPVSITRTVRVMRG
jgi:hypothetical protein